MWLSDFIKQNFKAFVMIKVLLCKTFTFCCKRKWRIFLRIWAAAFCHSYFKTTVLPYPAMNWTNRTWPEKKIVLSFLYKYTSTMRSQSVSLLDNWYLREGLFLNSPSNSKSYTKCKQIRENISPIIRVYI